MNKKIKWVIGIFFVLLSPLNFATPDRTQLAVWANEAIIATYSYDYKNFLEQQKEIAKYFTSEGWIAYTKALNESKLLETVKNNEYQVSSVATNPPKIITLDPTHWQATMPILVVYKNTKNQQQQTLKVIIGFSEAPAGQGVRGLSISSLKSTVSEPLCQCKKLEE